MVGKEWDEERREVNPRNKQSKALLLSQTAEDLFLIGGHQTPTHWEDVALMKLQVTF